MNTSLYVSRPQNAHELIELHGLIELMALRTIWGLRTVTLNQMYVFCSKVILYFQFHLVILISLYRYLRIHISFFVTSWHKLNICYTSFTNCK